MERLSLSTLLDDIRSNLIRIQDQLSASNKKVSGQTRILLEISRIVFGGWPAFAILFVIVFYFPLRNVLRSIPEKVQSAEEIQLAGVSLKTSIKKEALRVGAVDLSETIPALSSPAIDLLLRGPRKTSEANLVSYTPDPAGNYLSISFPSDSMIGNLTELENAGLAQVNVYDGEQTGQRPISGVEVKKLYENFRQKNPGQQEFWRDNSGDRVWWRPVNPIPKGSLPFVNWNLTDRGAQAVDIILKAVSAELAPKVPAAK